MCVCVRVCVCVDVDVSARVDADEVSTCDTFLAKKNSIANFPPIALARSLCRRSVRLLQHTIITYVFLFFHFCAVIFFMQPQRSPSAARCCHVSFFVVFFSLLLQKNINKIP